jgi:hypothetical protein
MAEVVAAFAVTSLAGTVLVHLLLSTRATVRASAERRLATEIAQGALERVRSAPLDGAEGIAADGMPVELPLPMATSLLQEARLTVSVEDWRGQAGRLAPGSPGARLNAGLRHIRVQVEWRSSRGGRRKVVREALTSDTHVQ